MPTPNAARDTVIAFRPIGIIHTPFLDVAGMPIQSAGTATEGSAIIDEHYGNGLDDIEGFSHLILLYAFHRACPYSPTVVPFLDSVPRGLFSTRAPCRPNPLGMSVVRLLSREGCCISFLGADMLDGTPLLDIKPYIPAFDAVPTARSGWFETCAHALDETRSDNRFL